MLDRALDRVLGFATAEDQRRAQRRLPELVKSLVGTAAELWEQCSFAAFDDAEENNTVQLYRWMKEVQRHGRGMRALRIDYEWMDLTQEIISGQASVKTARRPDLRVSVGEAVLSERAGVSIECKRLMPGSPWCRDYVHRGLARFVLESYGAGEPMGMMVGYVQGGDVATLLQTVNTHVAAHSALGVPGATLAVDGPAGSTVQWLSSSHGRQEGPIEVCHAWVKVR